MSCQQNAANSECGLPEAKTTAHGSRRDDKSESVVRGSSRKRATQRSRCACPGQGSHRPAGLAHVSRQAWKTKERKLQSGSSVRKAVSASKDLSWRSWSISLRCLSFIIQRSEMDKVEFRSKAKTAQTNEILCKILCHNVCCLIQSIYELGIEPTFWAE